MEHRKLSTLQKWRLKYTNRSAYNEYKEWLKEQEFYQHAATFQHPPPNHPYKEVTRFLHSGNSGDIIYSLPAVYGLSKNGKAEIYLQVDQPLDQVFSFHPLGSVMLNEKMIQLLKPLLLHQPQINVVEKYTAQPIDYNLDDFRKHKRFVSASITHWYFMTYGISYNTSLPWLTAPVDDRYKDTIVIARSHRYRQPLIDYSFLKNYPNKLFVGVAEEYEDMKKVLPNLEYKPVADFLELATMINSCRLFIGNQSFPFSLAEALKVTRLLEVYYKVPNVIVEGKGGNHFMYQPQFEYLVEQLYNKPS